MKDFVFCVSARGISKTASALRSSFDSVPYCFYRFVNVHKLDFLFRILSELRLSAQKARIVSAPAALICPNDTRGKDPWSFSPRGSPFSFKTRKKTRNTKRSARNHRRTQHKTQRTQKAHTLSRILTLSCQYPLNGFHLLTE